MSKLSHIQYGNRKITFRLKRSNRRKTVEISINPEADVIVSAPQFLRVDKIEEIIKKRVQWITEKQEFVNKQRRPGLVKEFVSGESLMYLGRQYLLRVILSDSEESCKLINGRFLVNIDEHLRGETVKETVKQALVSWYLDRAKEKIPERARLYASQIGKWPERIEIKNLKRCWGRCSHKGVIRLNWKTIMVPVTILDYVIVHELCHLIYLNHSKQFWQKVQTIIPDYTKRRKMLKEYSLRTGDFI